ncbi:hypothetical protein B0O80DRAFT_424378 [Mortierella sp. GBAus27b]|nr:hypothetical protein BGX31_004446 [Mortierella sp. GBA43]KAI8358322.1 hypothetical protein B0O80DRAFT_424378 [Mortierella sp. GBAus27b]
MTDQTETAAVETIPEAIASTEVEATKVEDATADSGLEGNDAKEEEKAKILKQVEFYFSDSNLPQDKFMTELVRKGKEGYVSISRIASFKRMREHKDMELIVEALRESKELLEVSEDNQMVRRRVPLVPQKDHFQRSIYAKGFGEETPSLQLELEEYFSALGDVKQVRMRRHADTNEFKGSVFVEYATLDEATKIGATTLQYKGKDLLVMTKPAYCEMKAKELGLDPNEVRNRTHSRGFNTEGKKRAREEDKPETIDDIKNKVIKMTGLACGENASLKDLKEKLKDHFRYGYVHWPKESDVLQVQVKSEDMDASKAIELLKSKAFEFNGVTPEMTVATDDESAAFLEEKKTWETSMASRGDRGRRGGRGGGRGARGGDRKKIRTQE